MMTEADDWGRDPQVRYLRNVFSQMEEAQKALFRHLPVSVLDPRLRRMREGALSLFERAWLTATRRGIGLSEGEFGMVYVHCLARLLRSKGIEVPSGALTSTDRVEAVMKEVK